jgi:hypothetical protein
VTSMRALTDLERTAIKALAAEFISDEERRRLLADLDNSAVEEKVPDGSLLSFSIPGYHRPSGHRQAAFRGKDGFPVEGVMKDADGAEISVYLFADPLGRIYEFELDRHAAGSVINPDWSTFRVR